MSGPEFEAKMERFFDRVEAAQKRAGQATRSFVDRHRWAGSAMLVGLVALYGGMFALLLTQDPPARPEDAGWHLPDWSLSTWSTVGVAVIAAATVAVAVLRERRGDHDD